MDRRKFFTGSAVAVTATALVGCSSGGDDKTSNSSTAPVASGGGGGSSGYDKLRQRGRLVVSTMTTIPPLAFKDESGKLVGFDVDISRLAAKSLFDDDTLIDFVEVASDGRWPAVQTGQSDFGLATTYMSRANIVSFSEPYLDTTISLLVSKKSGLKTLADVNKPGVTIAILNNPQMSARAKQYFPDAQVAIFDSFATQLLAVRTGRCQGMQTDSSVADYFQAQYGGDVETLQEHLGDFLGNALFVKIGEYGMLQWLNTFTRELRYGSLYSDYSKLYDKWFGKNPPPQRSYSA